MAARRLVSTLRTSNYRLGLGLGAAVLTGGFVIRYYQRRIPITADSAYGARMNEYETNAKVPVVKSGKLNPSAIKQLSAGSIAGLLGGVAVSVFSKPLAFLIGLLVFGVQVRFLWFRENGGMKGADEVQALESRGLHIIPYNRLQRWFRNTNIRSAVQDNVAFKLSFGATFALASFAEL